MVKLIESVINLSAEANSEEKGQHALWHIEVAVDIVKREPPLSKSLAQRFEGAS